MLAHVVTLLRCPHCGSRMVLDARVLRCSAGHDFDVARQGYVNLLPARPRTGSGDTAAMVGAREAFLSRGHYRPFADAVAVATSEGLDTGGPVAEVGAGTGYYLARSLHRRQGVGVALDVSTYASRRAARSHERVGAVVADTWGRLPLADASVQCGLVAFAPRAGGELGRVVRPGGRLVVLTPAPDHLGQLRDALGLLHVDPRKAERLQAALGTTFELLDRHTLSWTTELDHDDLTNLLRMGPSARHRSTTQLETAVGGMPATVAVTVSGVVHVLRRR